MHLSKSIEGFTFALASENKSLEYIASTQWHLQRFHHFCGDMRLAEIDTARIRAYLSFYQARGLAGHSVHAEYKTLSAL